ncbi:uncharacterized protein EI90DRAFT_3031214 [Cantharellus anzutake]|uniref:uncharacterized protein n=1 Tax=Cantharellus anzutake TaxID=1750568 RepID=UPI0019073DA1|nr:uncharacterized protein EI90DRAFT_3071036 [Cantharellus anzutake]XP_038923500.1 uncharacterized protein EI90DRAFT_3031214 [Cantharellus anzutake]KAF8326227.1 hypothetical protein EI90DRAFT_3071036 [Cantharellus anzutake]KAF8343055.1 hypothetical protein EI90DRAFT_3031214 [Cantharellus anzutake]
MAAIARVYQARFETHPAVTLAITNGTLAAFSDVVAQTCQILLTTPQSHPPRSLEFDPPPPRSLDFSRTARFAVFGIGMGPLLGRWNLFLENNFPLRCVGGKVSLKALGKRVLTDQALMAPTGLAIFIGSMGFMEGRNAAGVQKKFADMYKPAIIANWQVWPLAQLVNFRYMPLPYRVPFQATCGVFWTLYLSLLNAREDIKQDGPYRAKKLTL